MFPIIHSKPDDNSLSVAGSGSDLGALSSSKSISSPSKSPSKAKQGNGKTCRMNEC